jgi:hypothetical protein
MYRLLVITFILAFLSCSAAFSLETRTRAIGVNRSRMATTTTGFPAAASLTSTSLQLKVKVDPDQKKERMNPAVFKNSLYLGSIAFAVLLPVILLIAGSK